VLYPGIIPVVGINHVGINLQCGYAGLLWCLTIEKCRSIEKLSGLNQITVHNLRHIHANLMLKGGKKNVAPVFERTA